MVSLVDLPRCHGAQIDTGSWRINHCRETQSLSRNGEPTPARSPPSSADDRKPARRSLLQNRMGFLGRWVEFHPPQLPPCDPQPRTGRSSWVIKPSQPTHAVFLQFPEIMESP